MPFYRTTIAILVCLSILGLIGACVRGEAIPTRESISATALPTYTPITQSTTSPSPTPTPASVLGSVWNTRAPLPEPNSETAVTQLDNKIYVLGGYPSPRKSVVTVQVYDTSEDRWELAAPLPMPINHAMAAAFDGKVYVIGGRHVPEGVARSWTPFSSTIQRQMSGHPAHPCPPNAVRGPLR